MICHDDFQTIKNNLLSGSMLNRLLDLLAFGKPQTFSVGWWRVGAMIVDGNSSVSPFSHTQSGPVTLLD